VGTEFVGAGASVNVPVGTKASVGPEFVSVGVCEAGTVAEGTRAVGVGWTPHSEDSVAQAVNVNAVRRVRSRFMLAGIIPVRDGRRMQIIRWS